MAWSSRARRRASASARTSRQRSPRLETLSATQTARDAANRRDDVSADRDAAVSNAATQAQLVAAGARCNRTGASRSSSAPSVSSIDALPDVPLENADRIIVPPRPGFVTVVGAVVNNNAFLWRQGRTAGDYLRIAGADEAADTSNMFILRADGTVMQPERRAAASSAARGVDGEVMQPGDALIVPNQLDFETWGRAFVRNAKDWTQILANFGLGVAAIQILK